MATGSFAKSPAELVARFETVTARHPRLVARRTFGYPCTYLNGNMATGLFADQWFLRLAEADAAELAARPGAGAFSPMAGRPMKGAITLPPTIIGDDVALDEWIGRCIAHVGSLPPKA